MPAASGSARTQFTHLGLFSQRYGSFAGKAEADTFVAAIDFTGSYVRTLDLTGSSAPTLDFTGSYVPAIDFTGGMDE